uniref:Uncharacterized protein n=1 Tax=Eunotogramma sp. TaxID=2219035 RepID=A0A2U9NPY0_9STRA|nr:hypothetical protein ycf90 [Eunotogramma sp.]
MNILSFWLVNLLSLMINIDQETILRFLNIQGPYAEENYAFLGDVTMSTPVSGETVRLILEAMWDHYKNGLGFVDIENIALFILAIRFLFLSRKYNIKTAFYITCIGLGAGYLWYMHLRDLAYLYKRSLWMCRLTNNLAFDFDAILTQQQYKLRKAGTRFDSDMFYGPIIKAFTTITTDDAYRKDPLSMFWTYLPADIRFVADKIYYFLTLKVIPQTYKFIDRQVVGFSGILWYTFIVRINKKYCPYLIRWHWTFLLAIEFAEKPFVFAQRRLLYFLNEVLIPANEFRQAELVTNILIAFVACNYIFIMLGMLHALCGQYFYFPFFTENTELHIGFRPKDSIYSGGHTIWQNKRAYMISRQANQKTNKYRRVDRFFSILPRMWYGWLGRGTLDDLTQQEYETLMKKKNNQHSAEKARKRDAKIRWYYRQQKLKNRILRLLTKIGIFKNKKNDDDDELYFDPNRFSKNK